MNVVGTINGNKAVSGILKLESYNLSDRDMAEPFIDDYMKSKFRHQFRLLTQKVAMGAVEAL